MPARADVRETKLVKFREFGPTTLRENKSVGESAAELSADDEIWALRDEVDPVCVLLCPAGVGSLSTKPRTRYNRRRKTHTVDDQAQGECREQPAERAG